MKNVIVFQHVPHEILGTFHPLLKAAGLRIRYANFGRYPDLKVDVSAYDGLIVLGGPMGVYESDKHPHLQEEIAQIQKAIADDKPVLGICLGAQLIAASLGGKVAPSSQKEIGWFDIELTPEGKSDPLLSHLREKETVFQWHGDNLDLPPKAVWLARSPVCPYQAFRYGEKVYGLQFHLEVDLPLVKRWLGVPSMLKELTDFAGPGAEEKLRALTGENIEHLKSLSEKVFSTYLQLFSTKAKKKKILGSGHHR